MNQYTMTALVAWSDLVLIGHAHKSANDVFERPLQLGSFGFSSGNCLDPLQLSLFEVYEGA